jgi:uncharacterized protein (DUF1810 family)
MPSETDPFDLGRFEQAQAESYEAALAELRAGRKRTHWSWYVLPQIRGLGSSAMSVRYAISSLAEAQAYLAHPVLGHHARRSAAAILGEIDARKFHSCVTLFAQVAEADSPFRLALAKYFAGSQDSATLAMLAQQTSPP